MLNFCTYAFGAPFAPRHHVLLITSPRFLTWGCDLLVSFKEGNLRETRPIKRGNLRSRRIRPCIYYVNMFLLLSYNQINYIHCWEVPDFAAATESNTIKATKANAVPGDVAVAGYDNIATSRVVRSATENGR